MLGAIRAKVPRDTYRDFAIIPTPRAAALLFKLGKRGKNVEDGGDAAAQRPLPPDPCCLACRNTARAADFEPAEAQPAQHDRPEPEKTDSKSLITVRVHPSHRKCTIPVR
ncbi:hypothetical protein GCM10020366_69390 [Saccharopolyspora gregorii]|uniref:Uncharacterized protein n=1 Tax=Saccharopolyspora gregorii TaxID=33914 RepID=A0ABP6RJ42_9PSEU